MTEEILVRKAADMDAVTFAKHMELRHEDALGYLGRIPVGNPYLLRMWRSYHSALHRFRLNLGHRHNGNTD